MDSKLRSRNLRILWNDCNKMLWAICDPIDPALLELVTSHPMGKFIHMFLLLAVVLVNTERLEIRANRLRIYSSDLEIEHERNGERIKYRHWRIAH